MIVTAFDKGSYPAYHNFTEELVSLKNLNISHETRLYDQTLIPDRKYDNIFGLSDFAIKTLPETWSSINKDYNKIAPVSLISFDEVILANEILYIPFNGNYTPLYETYRKIDQTVVTAIELDGEVKSNIGGEAPTLYLGSVGSGNFGHWLVDDLPRLVCALNHLKNISSLSLLMSCHSESSDKFRSSTIKLLFPGLTFDFIFVDRNQPVIIKNAIYVTPTSFHPCVKSADALRELRNHISHLDLKPRGIPRIWLDRGSGHMRRVINESELISLLKRYELEVLDLTTTTIIEQIRYMMDAELVAGVVGAAMTNLLFAPSSATGVFATPAGWVEPFYWDLSSALGQRYNSIICRTVHPDNPPHVNDIYADIDLFDEALNKTCQTSGVHYGS